MLPAVGAGSGLFWEPCSGVFFPGSGSTPGSPSPMLWSGLSSGPVARPLPERDAWGARAALVGRAGQGRPSKRPGLQEPDPGHPAPCYALRFLPCGYRAPDPSLCVWGLAQDPAPLVLRFQHGLCAPAPDSAPPVMGTIIPATHLWSQPSRTHTEEGTLPYRRNS